MLSYPFDMQLTRGGFLWHGGLAGSGGTGWAVGTHQATTVSFVSGVSQCWQGTVLGGLRDPTTWPPMESATTHLSQGWWGKSCYLYDAQGALEQQGTVSCSLLAPACPAATPARAPSQSAEEGHAQLLSGRWPYGLPPKVASCDAILS